MIQRIGEIEERIVLHEALLRRKKERRRWNRRNEEQRKWYESRTNWSQNVRRDK